MGAELASIVIPVFNQLKYTKLCLESIMQNTDYPYELIFIDNGSTDDTPEYLHKVHNARVIRNERNLGFPKAINQGIRESRGRYVVVLNNDTLVTPSWLSRMVRCAERDERIGIVGVMTNSYVRGPQRDESARYSGISELYTYAEERAGKFADRILLYPLSLIHI